jgi:hypothetical protein
MNHRNDAGIDINMMPLADAYTKEILQMRWVHFRQGHDMLTKLVNETGLKIRRPNPPEDMTENFAKFIIQYKDNDPSCRWAKCLGGRGDLYSDKYTVEYPPEVKAFTSDGPCQFGPTKKFGVLYFLDLRKWTDDRIVLWRANVRSDSPEMKNVQITNTHTFEQQCIQGVRPHIPWNKLYPQLAPHCVKIYEGTFEDIFTTTSGASQ